MLDDLPTRTSTYEAEFLIKNGGPVPTTLFHPITDARDEESAKRMAESFFEELCLKHGKKNVYYVSLIDADREFLRRMQARTENRPYKPNNLLNSLLE